MIQQKGIKRVTVNLLICDIETNRKVDHLYLYYDRKALVSINLTFKVPTTSLT